MDWEKVMDEIFASLETVKVTEMKNEYFVSGAVTTIFLERKDGTFVEMLIDTEDLERMRDDAFTWGTHVDVKSGNLYVSRHRIIDGKSTKELVHRYVMGNPKGLVIDHINHNTLDNRKCNLRAITHAENLQNRKGASKNSKSGILGVSPDKKSGKWKAQIGINGKKISLGLFEDIKEAEKAVIAARKQYMPYAN